MKYVSLFAGVGGFDLGAQQAGWECAVQVEWDPHCQQVLHHHWPHIPKHDDVSTYHGATWPADVVVGGFPCQDVSLAGKRSGVLEDGTRSNLYRQIIRIVKEMRDATANTSPRWVVLENVRGLLSIDGGEGFRTILQDLADLGAIWTEWAMLDSQFFGVPQRRQRIFLVACFDPATAERSPQPLLPVSPRSKGNPGPSNKKRQKPAGGTEGSPRSRGFTADRGIVSALTAIEGMTRPDAAHAEAGWLIPEAVNLPHLNTTGTITTAFDSKNCTNLDEIRAGSIIPVSFALQPDDRNAGKGALRAVLTDIAPTIAASDGAKTSDRGLRIAYAVNENQRGELVENEIAGALSTGGGKPGQGHKVARIGNAIRRITPLECERLQGWPDNHTLHRADGTSQPDTTRYKQIGNGITANVAKWICERINIAENHTPH